MFSVIPKEVADFSNTTNAPSFRFPKGSDRFWFIDKKFCDREGWDDINNVDIINNLQFEQIEINAVQGGAFIDR
jgi:hypothetical protein